MKLSKIVRKLICFCKIFVKKKFLIIFYLDKISLVNVISRLRRPVISLGCLISIAFLPGCSSMMEHYLATSDSYPYADIGEVDRIESLGFVKQKYCQTPSGICMSYFLGQPLRNRKLSYNVELDGGSTVSQVQLALERRAESPQERGTVVLIHGFRISKEFMISSALYFRFLGFDVILPDLLGHGETPGEKAYGVGDSYIINDLINIEVEQGKALYLVGNSMGAVSAMYISSMREDINGIVLQAPMIAFDQAVLSYMHSNHPFLSLFLSVQDILDAASIALEKADLTVEETDIGPFLRRSKTSVLILASESDPVAPYSGFTPFESDVVSVMKFSDRNHPSMAVIGNRAHQYIAQWLADK
ncbi:alpha/beta hydrolase [Microbulbifer sp. 2201CG32-9]|uniref:alpha/beta hydrolase n=1 Tax=Microbulbifer sp. 2201CG32-9 TaxID=3232309 RepID=UPI00345C3A33